MEGFSHLMQSEAKPPNLESEWIDPRYNIGTHTHTHNVTISPLYVLLKKNRYVSTNVCVDRTDTVIYVLFASLAGRRIMTAVSFGSLCLLRVGRGLALLAIVRSCSFHILAVIFRNALIFPSVLPGFTSDIVCKWAPLSLLTYRTRNLRVLAGIP